jgi:hypothetical protein
MRKMALSNRNVLKSRSPEANPKYGTDYSVIITIFVSNFAWAVRCLRVPQVKDHWARRRGVGVRLPADEKDFSFLHNLQTNSSADQGSYMKWVLVLIKPPIWNGYKKIFPRGQWGTGVTLTIRFQLEPRIRMGGGLHLNFLLRLLGVVLN